MELKPFVGFTVMPQYAYALSGINMISFQGHLQQKLRGNDKGYLNSDLVSESKG